MPLREHFGGFFYHGTNYFTELHRSLSILSPCLVFFRTITTIIIQIIVSLTTPHRILPYDLEHDRLFNRTPSHLSNSPSLLFFVLHISFFGRCIRFLISLQSAQACPWAYKPEFPSLYTLFKFSIRHINQNFHLSILCSDLPLGIQTVILYTHILTSPTLHHLRIQL